MRACAMLHVAALYHFAPLAEPQAVREPLLQLCEENGIKGTLLLAHEGINGTIAGERAALDTIIDHIRSWASFADMDVKYSGAPSMPFGRMKVKVKPEIVTMGFADIDPRHHAGTHIAAKDWNALLDDPDLILIDTRNDFEVRAGTFPGAINPDTSTFRQFPAWFEEQQAQWAADGRQPKIAMFCTGGIRCEKATAFVKAKGFDEVYHLKGGILKYLEDVPESESRWQGNCFVFDERVGLGQGLSIETPDND
jgi:UPF0176 protein